MISIFVVSIFVLFTPVIAGVIAKKNKIAGILGPVALCYLFGMAGHYILAYLPGMTQMQDEHLNLLDLVSKNITEISIILAIPLLLFSADFKKWVKLAPKAVISFLLAVFSAVSICIIAGLLFKSHFHESWRLSGMLVGVYTGGTPNLNSIGKALNAPNELFPLVNAADIVSGGVYFLLLLTLVKPLLSKILPPFKDDEDDSESFHDLNDRPKSLPEYARLAGAFLLTIISLGAGLGLSILFYGDMNNAPIILLTITSLGIAFSFVKKIRSIAGTFLAGNFLVLVFCVALGLQIDFAKLFNTGGIIFLFVVGVLSVSIILHFALCYLFKIDVDHAIITNTAAIYGAPFIIPVAEAIGNKKMIITGLTTSLIGYAIGNYLGLAVAYILK